MRGKTCEAIKGILKEGEEIIEAYEDTAALDAGLVAWGQAVAQPEPRFLAAIGTGRSGPLSSEVDNP